MEKLTEQQNNTIEDYYYIAYLNAFMYNDDYIKNVLEGKLDE